MVTYWVTDIWQASCSEEMTLQAEKTASAKTEIENCRASAALFGLAGLWGWVGSTGQKMGREAVEAWFSPPLPISLLECNSLGRTVSICLISSLSFLLHTKESLVLV